MEDNLDSLWQSFKKTLSSDLAYEKEIILKTLFYSGAMATLFLLNSVGLATIRDECEKFLEETEEKIIN